MTNKIPAELYEEFFKLAKGGDEIKARKFLTDNLDQFPQEMQDAIITAFIEEALSKQNNNDRAIAGIKEQGLEAISVLQRTKIDLEKKLKLSEIKESI